MLARLAGPAVTKHDGLRWFKQQMVNSLGSGGEEVQDHVTVKSPDLVQTLWLACSPHGPLGWPFVGVCCWRAILVSLPPHMSVY